MWVQGVLAERISKNWIYLQFSSNPQPDIYTPNDYMNNFYLVFVELSATAYGRDIFHIYHVVTVIILFCKHWGSHSAFNFLSNWICIL
jgi:hypothetical protein